MMYEHFLPLMQIITDETKIRQILADYVKETYGERATWELIRFEIRTRETAIFYSVNRKHQKQHVSYDSCGGNRRRHTRT